MLEVTTEASQAVQNIMSERQMDSPLRIFLAAGG